MSSSARFNHQLLLLLARVKERGGRHAQLARSQSRYLYPLTLSAWSVLSRFVETESC
jgi:hypothetical protein